MQKAVISDSPKGKVLISDNYNFIFDKQTGFFARWGKTKEEDPQWSPYGPEIADIEISTICSGVPGVGVCKFCYKGNTPKGRNMSLDTFKQLFAKLPKTVGQIAFGIGDIDSNPDMWAIFDYARENGVIPNVTVNGAGITDEIADRLVKTCGAVAVSLYDKDATYNTIKKLTDRGLKQVNIHFMISEQTYDTAVELLNDRLTDERISKMNAIVFLGLKPKGRAKNNFTVLAPDKFKKLVDFALENKIGLGFDSCSCFKFLKSVENSPKYKQFEQVSEPCESTCFSIYFNTDGKFFPCSFMEGEQGWEDGIDILSPNIDFSKDLWLSEKTGQFRSSVLNARSCGKNCSHYNI